MGRRAFVSVLAGGLLAAPLAAAAQQGKVYKVGMLTPDDRLGVQSLRQFEVAAWCVLTVYLAMVAYFDSLKLWRKS